MKDLIELCNISSKYTVGFEGNVSEKVTDNVIIIKASGTKLKNITNEDFVTVKDGTQVNNLEKKPSMELSFHSLIYEMFNCRYVSHTHPVNTVSILCSDRSDDFANKRLFPDQVIFNGHKSCLVEYKKPGKELAEEIKNSVKKFEKENGVLPEIILLKNHGLIVWGNSILECEMKMDICEKSSIIFNNSNELNFLSDDDIVDLLNDDKEKIRKSKL